MSSWPWHCSFFFALALIALFVTIVAGVIIFRHFLPKLYSKDVSEIGPLFKHLSAAYCVLLWAAALLQTGSHFISVAICFGMTGVNHVRIVLQALLARFYIVALMLLSLIFLMRLKTTFANTVFAPSKCTFRTLATLIVLNCLLSPSAAIIYLGEPSARRVAGYVVVFVIFSYIVTSAALLVLFIKSLIRLSRQHHTENNHVSTELVPVISKLFILVVCTLTSTFVLSIFVMVNNVFGPSVVSNLMYMSYSPVEFEFVVDLGALILQFAFNSEHYYRLCRKPDAWLQSKIMNIGSIAMSASKTNSPIVMARRESV